MATSAWFGVSCSLGGGEFDAFLIIVMSALLDCISCLPVLDIILVLDKVLESMYVMVDWDVVHPAFSRASMAVNAPACT